MDPGRVLRGEPQPRCTLADLDQYRFDEVDEGWWTIVAEAWSGEWRPEAVRKVHQAFEITPGSPDLELDLDLAEAVESAGLSQEQDGQK